MQPINSLNGVNKTQETINSLFSNQDPWMLLHNSQPSGKLELDFYVSHGRSTIGQYSICFFKYVLSLIVLIYFLGLAKELIKQELQMVVKVWLLLIFIHRHL